MQVLKLKDQLETTLEKLNESKEVLKTNENGESCSFISTFRIFFSITKKLLFSLGLLGILRITLAAVHTCRVDL